MTDVALDVFADFHFEKAESPPIPSASQGDGLIEVGDGNGDVRFPCSHIRAPPQLPHRDILCLAVGVDDGGFESTTCGRMRGRLFGQQVPDFLIVCGRTTKDGLAKLVKCEKATLAGFSSDFWERCCFAITLRAADQRDSQKDVCCNRSRTGGNDEGVRNGDIDGPVLNSYNGGRERAYPSVCKASGARSSVVGNSPFPHPLVPTEGWRISVNLADCRAAVPMFRAKNKRLFSRASCCFRNFCRECTPACRVSPRCDIDTLAGTAGVGEMQRFSSFPSLSDLVLQVIAHKGPVGKGMPFGHSRLKCLQHRHSSRVVGPN